MPIKDEQIRITLHILRDAEAAKLMYSFEMPYFPQTQLGQRQIWISSAYIFKENLQVLHTYAAVALKMSTIRPFVNKPNEREKIAVKAPIVPRRLSMLRMKKSTTMEATGRREARTIVMAPLTRSIPFWE